MCVIDLKTFHWM